ncbi:MAG: NAD(P)-dependent alcohol dehydrogenase [Planctomycetes bacterium]|nr:NAD(P)-dependent alcohol dehydrogenase [Planctomycetota bacterium]
MLSWELSAFGLENLRCIDRPRPAAPGPGQVLVRPRALSLNYRDWMIVQGEYNPRLRLPAVPISDGAGVVEAVGEGVSTPAVGDAVVVNFVSGWIDGPFRREHISTTLGLPGPGLATEGVVLAADAVLPIPRGYGFSEAATLPIAALTAWSALVTAGGLDFSRGDNAKTVLTLGTGGVSIFALQLAKAMGARVIITSSSDEKLERAKSLGADEGVNYSREPEWERRVLELTDGEGADITVETGGGGTFNRSLLATRAGGCVALMGALTGLSAQASLGPIIMRRLRVAGIMVDSAASMAAMIRFIEEHQIVPVIDRTFPFEQLPDALRFMQTGGHLGKLVVRGAGV